MIPHFVITRTRDTVTSICRTCGETSGLTRSDTAALMWQRTHRPKCGREDAHGTPASPVKAPRSDEHPSPRTTRPPARSAAPTGPIPRKSSTTPSKEKS